MAYVLQAVLQSDNAGGVRPERPQCMLWLKVGGNMGNG